jgi:hypothetical protein
VISNTSSISALHHLCLHGLGLRQQDLIERGWCAMNIVLQLVRIFFMLRKSRTTREGRWSCCFRCSGFRFARTLKWDELDLAGNPRGLPRSNFTIPPWMIVPLSADREDTIISEAVNKWLLNKPESTCTQKIKVHEALQIRQIKKWVRKKIKISDWTIWLVPHSVLDHVSVILETLLLLCDGKSEVAERDTELLSAKMTMMTFVLYSCWSLFWAFSYLLYLSTFFDQMKGLSAWRRSWLSHKSASTVLLCSQW